MIPAKSELIGLWNLFTTDQSWLWIWPSSLLGYFESGPLSSGVSCQCPVNWFLDQLPVICAPWSGSMILIQLYLSHSQQHWNQWSIQCCWSPKGRRMGDGLGEMGGGFGGDVKGRGKDLTKNTWITNFPFVEWLSWGEARKNLMGEFDIISEAHYK